MSKDERKFDSFVEISSDEEENMSILERLLRAPAGSNVQNWLARGNVGDASNEPTSQLFHRTSGLRNPICSDMGAEGGQNVVRSSENVQQSAEYSFLQPTSNKRNISDTNDSVSGCKNTRFCEMNRNESSCQPLDLSIRGTSYKTDGIVGVENSICQRVQSNTSTSSKECSGSALSSAKNSRDQGKEPVCDVCGKEFCNLSTLRRHKKIHTGEKPHVCKFCQKAFNRNDHFGHHMRTHTDERPYVCDICQRAFNRSDVLVSHMRTHTGERPYICEICQRAFSTSFILKRHVAIHSGTKSHHYDYCDYENAHKPSLDKHLEAHHSEHKEKWPVCCDYFYSKKSLQSHKCKKL